MELLASGHNAWGQLDFANSNPQEFDDTDDFAEFKVILQGRVIKQVQAFLSYTRCRFRSQGRRYSKAYHHGTDTDFMIGQ